MLVILFDQSDNVARWRDLDPRESLAVAALLGPDDPDSSAHSAENHYEYIGSDLCLDGRFGRRTDAWQVWSLVRAIARATASANARCCSRAVHAACSDDVAVEPCRCRSDAA